MSRPSHIPEPPLYTQAQVKRLINRRAAMPENPERYCQFSIEPGNKFRPARATVESLPSGIYEAGEDGHGYYFRQKDFSTRDLLRFPNTIADEIIKESIRFWDLAPQYASMGEPHKRAYLLHGPPGSGKSSLITWLINDFIANDDIVFFFNDDLLDCLDLYRQVATEQDRRNLIVLEDIDMFMQDEDYDSKHGVLQFLDGSIQLSNTIIVATTNYPERLEDRVINRPSRFDRVAEIGMPGPNERAHYIKNKTLNPLDATALQTIVADTDGLSLAHIKELLVSTQIFGDDYNLNLERLQALKVKPSSEPKMKGLT